MGFRPASNLAEQIKGSDALIIAGADPVGDQTLSAETLRKPEAFIVVQELFLTETAKLADVVFPVQASTEREGTYTSGERRVQRFYPINTPPELKPDFIITAGIAQKLGVALEDRSAALVFQQLSAQVEGYENLSYTQLAEVVEQIPPLDREDLYYGGTTYSNRQGIGVQLEIDKVHSRLMKLADLAAPQPLQVGAEGQLVLLPVTRLYDQGAMLAQTHLLDQRIAQAEVSVSPATARALGLNSGDQGQFNLAGKSYLLPVVVQDNLPDGVALLPRSVGLPLVEPVVTRLELVK